MRVFLVLAMFWSTACGPMEAERAPNGPGDHDDEPGVDAGIDEDANDVPGDADVPPDADTPTPWAPTFERRTDGIVGGGIYDVAVDPALPNVVYACARGTDVRKSTNGGVSFAASSTGLPASDQFSCYGLVAGPGHVVVATSSGLFITRDGGATWTPGPTGDFRTLTRDGNRIYAGAYGYWEGYLWRSADGGVTWDKSPQLPPSAWGHALAVSPQDSTLYIGTYTTGVYAAPM